MEVTKKTASFMLRTALWSLHKDFDGHIVDFAGYQLPVQYKHGVKKEHLHVREKAGLFDVSHMGQVMIFSDDGTDPAIALEKIVPSDIQNLEIGQMRYTVLLKADGGILDDLIVTRISSSELYAVLNASRKEIDIEYILDNLSDDIDLKVIEEQSLLALQGPMAEKIIIEALLPDAGDLKYMNAKYTEYKGQEILITRSGYTGEDGFEISVPDSLAEDLTKELLQNENLWLIGLGARDSLRLEAGFCLYGHDITEGTTPIEGGIGWVIPKNRREKADFAGADKVISQIKDGVPRKRVGLSPMGKAPVREGVEIFDDNDNKIGVVTSGGFSPVLEVPIAMAYIEKENAKIDNIVIAKMRGKDYPCKIIKMPFIKKGE